MANLTFGNVDEELLAAFPQLRDAYLKEFDYWGKGKPGQYLVFGFLLDPLLELHLQPGGDPATLRRIFDFLEDMAGASDAEVVNLLQVSELEFLVGRPELVSRAWGYMGKKTRALAKETAKIWKCEHNLPEGT